MYLRKRYMLHLLYILIPVFFLIFAAQTNAETLITGQILNNQSDPISGIEVTAFDSTGYGIAGLTSFSDSSGNYELDVDSMFGTSSDPIDFYVCVQDPNNIYITECYDEYYLFFSEENEESITPITVDRGETRENIDFQLCYGGNIKAYLNVPYNRGYKFTIQGTVNFKKSLNIQLEPQNVIIEQSYLPSDKWVDFIKEVGPLPYGNYSVSIEDINVTNYHKEVVSSTSYFYQIHDFNYLFKQYYDHKSSAEQSDTVSLSNNNLVEQITFSNLSEAGMIYGIITDPNMEEKTSETLIYQTSSGGKSLVSYFGAEDPDTKEWHDQITLILDPNKPAIENIYLKIIPLDGQQVIEPIIPCKVLKDPNSVFHIGGDGEFGFGGYAFKLLDPSGNYKIQLFRQRGNTNILNVYYNDATSIVYSKDEATEINLTSGEKIKKVDIEVEKVLIHGYVKYNGNPITADVILMTNPGQGSKEIHQIMSTQADANCNSYFAFHELITGDFVVRVECDDMSIERRYVNNVQLGQTRYLGTIGLKTYEACGGGKEIHGRVFFEEDPSIGLENIHVRVLNTDDINYYDNCLTDITDPNGRYSIPNLPDSLYIVYTVYDPNIVSAVGDPNIIKGGYFNEMYNNVTLFSGPDTEGNIFLPEIDVITNMKAYFDPLNIDPNIPATLVGFGEGEDDRIINFGLSSHNYHFSKGFHLFGYPGAPPVNYAGKAINLMEVIPYSSYPKIMSYGNNWKATYRDPNDGLIKGEDFSIKAGGGYGFYVYNDVYIFSPPFTITPLTINLVQGLNLISIPESFEKEYNSRNILSDLGGAENKSCSINHFNSRAGKWKSTNCLWGLPAGDNFKFKRHRGYLVYMKSSNQWQTNE